MADVRRENSNSQQASVVKAVITEDHIAVLDAPVHLLEPLLQYTRRTFVPGGLHGYLEIEERVWLYDVDVRGRPCFPAGLWPRVRRTLQEHGYQVAVEDHRTPGPRLTVDDSVLDGADDRVKPLLQAVVGQPLGRIEAATKQDVLDHMLLIAEVFPEASVVVAVATRRQAWSLWRKLREHLGGTVGLAWRGAKEVGKRWLVGTFGSIPRNRAGTFDILLLPYAEEAVGNRAIDMFVGMEFRRVYAFVQPGRRPDRLVQIRLEQMAGPVIYRVKKPRVPAHVLMLSTPACPVASAQTALERKRVLYWHNDARNGHVAAVAQAVVSGDRAALKAVGLRNRDIRLLKGIDNNRVAVLVESPEHGRKLLARLPGWRMLDLVPGNRATAGGEGTVEGRMPAVVTAAYAAKNTIKTEVVVRATGTGWPLRMKGFPPKKTKRGLGEVLVIDFDDGFSADAGEDALRRVQEYQRRGMKVTGLNHLDQGATGRKPSGGP